MDIDTIDRTFADLQTQSQDTAAKLQALAQKLQAAASAGDQNAREWMLDLREIALAVRDEESHVGSLLQAMHGFAANAIQAPAVAPDPQQSYEPYGQQPGYPPQQQPGYPPQQPGYPPQYGQQPGYPPGYGQQPGYPPQGGNPLSGFMNSGFGRAVTMGLGFGVGDDLINKIF